jgi:outer membrane protein assembly factor BamB
MSDVAPMSYPQAAATTDRPTTQSVPSLRLWPAVVIIIVEWLVIKIPAWIAPVTFAHFMGWFLGPMIATVALLLWWMFASRLSWRDRWFGFVVFGAVGGATLLLSHASIGGFGLVMNGLPLATTAWVLWLAVTRSMRWPPRRAGLAAVLLLAFAPFTLVRMEGTNGALVGTFQFRWSPTAEDHYLAEAAAGTTNLAPATLIAAADAAPLVLQPGDWPGFRGANRDGRLEGVRLTAPDWSAHPPRELWRRRIGPGWSSFAAVSDRVFTQEQRGAEELVVCYSATTGAEIWKHADHVRFEEMMAGPGPRATPEFHDGKIYALGATGKLNCLDAASGRSLWSHDIAADAQAKIPIWGFSASPLVREGIVTVFAGGPSGKSVLGYNALSGELAWAAGEGELGYCSLQPARLCGVDQLLISNERGLTAFSPAKGDVLWKYKWLVEGMNRVALPVIVGDADVLIGTSFGLGTRRVHLRRDGAAWTPEEVWKSSAIKPYFNDMVVEGGLLFGFDNNILTCVNLADGKGKWRAEGYGNGQLLLLADQSMLLILSESGEIAWVDASGEAVRNGQDFKPSTERLGIIPCSPMGGSLSEMEKKPPALNLHQLQSPDFSADSSHILIFADNTLGAYCAQSNRRSALR